MWFLSECHINPHSTDKNMEAIAGRRTAPNTSFLNLCPRWLQALYMFSWKVWDRWKEDHHDLLGGNWSTETRGKPLEVSEIFSGEAGVKNG